MTQHFATLRRYDSLLERADWFCRIQLECIHHLIPTTDYKPRVVDPCDIKTAGYDGGQCVASLLQQKTLPHHGRQDTAPQAFWSQRSIAES